ncbi:MAG: hypothetical protein ACFCU3_04480, partial [Verrucomicrobiales bacterium]
ADDFIAVAVDGRTVMHGGRPDMLKLPEVGWEPPEPDGMNVRGGRLRYSDWLELEENTPIDLDVVIGERPGGSFSALLYWQEQGESYYQGNGGPILPAFQLAPAPVPDREASASGYPVWKAVP